MASTLEELGVRRAAQPYRRVAADGRPILVATDASASSDAALRAAQAIALHTLRTVRVVAVTVPPPVVAMEVAVVESPGMAAERREALRARVREQFARVGLVYEWPVEVVTGDPAATIVRVANESNAGLVIMGLGRHRLVDRLLGDETALRVLRLGRTPVLAVAPNFARLPLRVVAATDFSVSSALALTLAGQVIHPFGTVMLAHVAAPEPGARASGEAQPLSNEATRAFDAVLDEAQLPPSVSVLRKVFTGEPSPVLTGIIRRARPDLVVVGSHGHGFLSRLILGSVSQTLVRHAGCSVLVAPPQAAPDYLEEVSPATSPFTAYEWAERLEEFTRRNVSRAATLEVIDPEIGAQVEEHGLPFMGASYDPRDGRVQIMLGDGASPGRHLTRTIAAVKALQVLRDRKGRDLVLRVAHGRGQTLLTLER